MRKNIDRMIFRVARFGLGVTMIGCLLSALAAIITVSFNISTRIPLGKNRWTVLSDFERGIPFNAVISAEIPDSSIASGSIDARSTHYYYANDYYLNNHEKNRPLPDSAIYTDKIISDFKVLNSQGELKDIKIGGAKFGTAVFYLQPRKFWDRVLLSLPVILTLLLIAFCSWQIYKLIGAIHSGESFSQSSVQRIARIGWAVLFMVLLFFILDIVQKDVTNILLNFSSTIPDYRPPFYATAYKQGYFRLDWLIGGAIILLIAKAFRYGNQLQNYEDSTI